MFITMNFGCSLTSPLPVRFCRFCCCFCHLGILFYSSLTLSILSCAIQQLWSPEIFWTIFLYSLVHFCCVFLVSLLGPGTVIPIVVIFESNHNSSGWNSSFLESFHFWLAFFIFVISVLPGPSIHFLSFCVPFALPSACPSGRPVPGGCIVSCNGSRRIVCLPVLPLPYPWNKKPQQQQSLEITIALKYKTFRVLQIQLYFPQLDSKNITVFLSADSSVLFLSWWLALLSGKQQKGEGRWWQENTLAMRNHCPCAGELSVSRKNFKQ